MHTVESLETTAQASSVALVPCKTKREGKDRDKKEGREGKARQGKARE